MISFFVGSDAQLTSARIINNTPSTSTTSDEFQGAMIPINVYLHNHVAITLEIEDTKSATCDIIFEAILNCDELGLNKHQASQVFSLWMVSPLLGKIFT